MASIAKRPDGRWRARYRDEAGKEHARHFHRKVDAQRWLDTVTTAVITGQYVDPKATRITFANYYARWSEPQLWISSTRKSMDLTAGSVTFANLPMGSIRKIHLERWIKEMTNRGLAASTVGMRVKSIRAVFKGAVAERIIPNDPTVSLKVPRLRRAEVSMIIPTPSEVGRLLTAAEAPFRAYLGLCAFAGLRLGEASGIQVRDIDFLRRRLAVARQVQRDGNGFDIRAPKRESERTVFLAPTLVSILTEHIRNHAAGEDPGRWLFSGNGTDPLHHNTVGYRWRCTMAAAGLSGFRLHDLRHFFASGLIASGCDVVTVQRALGHQRATTTLNTYAHLWPTAEDRTRAAAEDLLAEALRATTEDSADSQRTVTVP